MRCAHPSCIRYLNMFYVSSSPKLLQTMTILLQLIDHRVTNNAFDRRGYFPGRSLQTRKFSMNLMH